MSVDLSDVPVLVSEHAAAAVVANLFSVEGSAVFGSQFIVKSGCSSARFEFVMPVGKLAFFAISAEGVFDPVFAKLGLVALHWTFLNPFIVMVCHCFFMVAARGS